MALFSPLKADETPGTGFLTALAAAVQLPHMRHFLSRIEFALILKNVVVFAVYFGTAKYFLALTAVNTFAAIIWPSSGIALAAVVLWGYGVTPAIFAAAFAVNASMGAAVFPSLIIGLGNSLESVAGAYFLRRFIGFDFMLSRVRDALGIVACAPVVALISASVGVSALTLTGVLSPGTFSSTFLAWWAGDTVAMLVITPFLVRWVGKPLFKRRPSELLEGATLFLMLIAIDVVTFYGPLGSQPGSSTLIFATLIPLIWAALRAGPRGTTLAILLTAIISSSGTLRGYGPLIRDAISMSQSLEILQIFKAMCAVTFLLFVAAVEERKEVLRRSSEYVDKLELAVHKVSSSDQAKNDFLAILGHELRNPLASMVSSLELLKLEGASTPRKRELIAIIDKQMHNMARLLDDLLDMSRITKRKFKIQKEIVSLEKVLLNATQSVSSFMVERNHTFSIDAPQELVYLDIDPLRIEQAIINLLNNAAKYTEPGGAISLRARAHGNTAVIEVSDTGAGIAAELHEKIFEPFVQGTASLSRHRDPGTGLGIGLALTKRLVELHRGSIEAESAGPGKGSLFRITLPLASKASWPSESPQSPLKLPKQEGIEVQGAPLSPRKVLIVDDNVDAAKGLSLLLRHKGHDVTTAYDGASALTLVDSFKPDAVVLDIGLPDMDGYEAARRIRENRGDSCKLIALTGYGLEEDKLRARVAGFDRHLTKPIGIAELERALS